MARIYNPQDYGNLFEGKARSVAYNPVQAVDTSAQERQRRDENVRDAETMARAQQRQDTLDKVALRLEGETEKARLAAKGTMINGLLALSKTGLQAAEQIHEVQEQVKADKELDDFLFGSSQGGDINTDPNAATPGLDQAEAAEAQDEAVLDASSQGIHKAAPDDPVTREQIGGQQVGEQQKALSVGQRGVYEAAATVGADLDTYLKSDIMIVFPGETEPRPVSSATTSAEVAFAAAKGLRALGRAYGLQGTSPKELRRTYFPAAQNALSNSVRQRVAQVTKGAQDTRVVEAVETYRSGLNAPGVNQQQLWDNLSAALFNSQKYNSRAEANEAAFGIIVDELVKRRDIEGLSKLYTIQKVPGNAGTAFGKTHKAQIDTAINEARRGAVGDQNITRAEDGLALEKTQQTYLTTIVNAKTPEERARATAIYRDDLIKIGSKDALATVVNLDSKPDNYSPQNAIDLANSSQESGQPPSQERLVELLNGGFITEQEYKNLGGLGVSSDGSPLQPISKSEQTALKGLASGVLGQQRTLLATGKAKGDWAAVEADLQQQLVNYMTQWRQENPDATNSQFLQEATRYSQSTLKGQMEGVLTPDQYKFGSGRATTNKQQQDFSDPADWTPNKLEQFIKQNGGNPGAADINTSKDILLNEQELKEALPLHGAGQSTYGPRVNEVARILGISPAELVEKQAQLRYGKAAVDAIRKQRDAAVRSDSTNRGPKENYEVLGISPKASERMGILMPKASPQEAAATIDRIRNTSPGSYAVLTNPNSSGREIDSVLINAESLAQSPPVGPRLASGTLAYRGNEVHYQATGRALQGLGFKVAENPDFGGVQPVHSEHGYHPHGEAFDITHWQGSFDHSIQQTARLKAVVRGLQPPLFREIIGPGDGDPNHNTHLHLGGLLRPITPADVARINAALS